MSISISLFTPPSQHLSSFSSLSSRAPQFTHTAFLSLTPVKPLSSFSIKVSADNGAGISSSTATIDAAGVEKKVEEVKEKDEVSEGNGSVPVEGEVKVKISFEDPRWVNGTWDLKQFEKNGKTDWDAVIDAEARRRKWLEDNPESSSNHNPVVFHTSIIPWWAWMKRFHLPEAELLNGRAAMIGFFMAYFVDSLTGVGLVDQTNNFFCKTLLFITVVGVLLIRKNEDIENLKKLFEETTFYDKQWQATWQDDSEDGSKKK